MLALIVTESKSSIRNINFKIFMHKSIELSNPVFLGTSLSQDWFLNSSMKFPGTALWCFYESSSWWLFDFVLSYINTHDVFQSSLLCISNCSLLLWCKMVEWQRHTNPPESYLLNHNSNLMFKGINHTWDPLIHTSLIVSNQSFSMHTFQQSTQLLMEAMKSLLV